MLHTTWPIGSGTTFFSNMDSQTSRKTHVHTNDPLHKIHVIFRIQSLRYNIKNANMAYIGNIQNHTCLPMKF